MLFASAVLTGLSVAFSKYVGFIEWFSMIPLVLALLRIAADRKRKLRHAYLYGLFYFECFYAVCFHWFTYLYPLDFTGLDGFGSVMVILVAVFGLSFLQALFGGFLFVLFTLISRLPVMERIKPAAILLLPALYSFYEYTQTLGWWGVPWGRLPLGQTDYLITVQISSLLGSYAVTFILVFVNVCLAYAFLQRTRLDKLRRYCVLALSVFLVNILTGTLIFLTTRASSEKCETVTVGIVQGNYDSKSKWSESPSAILDKHLALTQKCVEEGAELIIWAETALPYSLSAGGARAEEIQSFARETGVTILVGAIEYGDNDTYNAIFCFNSDGTLSETVYHKRRLVPFGEFVPMRNIVEVILPFLSDLSMLSDDMTPGDEADVFETSDGYRVGSLICFDSIYESLVIDTARDGAELIALSTNDSWFSDSAGIYMHNNQARLRSIETGKYTARCANTGVSTVISSTGEVLCEIAPLTEGYLTEEVRLIEGRTLYTYIGNLFVYLCLAASLAPIAYEIAVLIINKVRDGKGKTQHGGGDNGEKQ